MCVWWRLLLSWTRPEPTDSDDNWLTCRRDGTDWWSRQIVRKHGYRSKPWQSGLGVPEQDISTLCSSIFPSLKCGWKCCARTRCCSGLDSTCLLFPASPHWSSRTSQVVVSKKFEKQEVEFQFLFLPRSFFIIITIFFSCHSFSRKTYLLVLWEGEVFYLLLLWDLSWWCVHYPHYTAEKAKFGSMSSTNPLQQRHHIYKLYIYSVLCTEKRLISICCDREGVASRLFHRSSQEQQVHCHTPGVQNSLGPPSGHAVFLVMAFKMQERGGTGGGRGGFRF